MNRAVGPASYAPDIGPVLTLIGEIYDAALELSQWPRVLNTLARLTHCDAIILAVEDASAESVPSNEPRDESGTAQDRGGCSVLWVSDGAPEPSVTRGPTLRDGSLGTNTFSMEVLSDDSARALIAGWRGNRHVKTVDAESVLRPLLPHLRRAVDLMLRAKRLEGRQHNATASLDRIAQPLILLNSNQRVVFANRAARRILKRRDGLAVDGDRLRAMTDRGQVVLERLYEESSRWLRASDAGERTFVIERPSRKEPLQVVAVTLARLRTLGRSDERASLALFFLDSESPEVEEETLIELFGLTPAESRIAAGLASGLSLAETSRQLEIGVTTARWHLKHVFAKTKTSRQPELVSILLRSVAAVERT